MVDIQHHFEGKNAKTYSNNTTMLDLQGYVGEKERELQERIQHELEEAEKERVQKRLKLIKESTTRYDRDRLALTKQLIEKTPQKRLENMMNRQRSIEQKEYAANLSKPRSNQKKEKNYSFLPDINKNTKYGKNRVSIFERAKRMNATKMSAAEIAEMEKKREKRAREIKNIEKRHRAPRRHYHPLSAREENHSKSRHHSDKTIHSARRPRKGPLSRFDDRTLDDFESPIRPPYKLESIEPNTTIEIDDSVSTDGSYTSDSSDIITKRIKVPKVRKTKVTRRRYRIIRSGASRRDNRRAQIIGQYSADDHYQHPPQSKVRRKLISKQVFHRQRMVDEEMLIKQHRHRRRKKKKSHKSNKKQPAPPPNKPNDASQNSYRKRISEHSSISTMTDGVYPPPGKIRKSIDISTMTGGGTNQTLGISTMTHRPSSRNMSTMTQHIDKSSISTMTTPKASANTSTMTTRKASANTSTMTTPKSSANTSTMTLQKASANTSTMTTTKSSSNTSTMTDKRRVHHSFSSQETQTTPSHTSMNRSTSPIHGGASHHISTSPITSPIKAAGETHYVSMKLSPTIDIPMINGGGSSGSHMSTPHESPIKPVQHSKSSATTRTTTTTYYETRSPKSSSSKKSSRKSSRKSSQRSSRSSSKQNSRKSSAKSSKHNSPRSTHYERHLKKSSSKKRYKIQHVNSVTQSIQSTPQDEDYSTPSSHRGSPQHIHGYMRFQHIMEDSTPAQSDTETQTIDHFSASEDEDEVLYKSPETEAIMNHKFVSHTETESVDMLISNLMKQTHFEEYDPYGLLTEEIYRHDNGDDGLTVEDMPLCDCGCGRVMVELLPSIKLEYQRELVNHVRFVE
mmetsp:Transcript_3040/g.4464  ORF Transcript_3040/g.4464 Transcript_3040/m.4464 type:complete len:851 (+) Transcript_3040:199-2751(+)